MKLNEEAVKKAYADIINSFLHPPPRLICICGNFEILEADDMCFYKCKNCGGWMSLKRIVENGKTQTKR